MEYTALKRNETLILATTWMNFANLMLNDVNQTQDKYCEFTYMRYLG